MSSDRHFLQKELLLKLLFPVDIFFSFKIYLWFKNKNSNCTTHMDFLNIFYNNVFFQNMRLLVNQ